jgi:hypothetical protein
VEAKNLLRGFGSKRPSDGGSVETAGQDMLAIGRNGDRPDWPAMAGELSPGSLDAQRQRGCN